MTTITSVVSTQDLTHATIRTETVNGTNIYIVDGMLSSKEIKEFYDRILKISFTRDAKDFSEDDYVSFAADMEVNPVIKKTAVGKRAEYLLNHFYQKVDYAPFKVLVNSIQYGDMPFPHTDCNPVRKDITILYYVNEKWHYSWGGENYFYDEQKEGIMGILPKPGRFVLFPGFIEHRVGVTTPNCPTNRLTLAMKFSREDQISAKKLKRLQ